MDKAIQKRIIDITNAASIRTVILVQPLWNNYGTLSRIMLDGSSYKSVILKHIRIPHSRVHPKGFGGSVSQQRKIKSYQVEQYWYKHYNNQVALSKESPTPICLDTFHKDGEIYLLLEDIHNRGYTALPYQASKQQIDIVIRWLAYFHAQFLQEDPTGLWETGTYWHLETRPEELETIQGSSLYDFASFIDALLSGSKFQTIVHGDAKLANFCFHNQKNAVAAVDFQYIGKGNGMKDLSYFIGSVMNEHECKRNEEAVLHSYFSYLSQALENSKFSAFEIEQEWRPLYHVACADFQRFLMGWSPVHSKNTSYSKRLTDKTVQSIQHELLNCAISACKKAASLVMGARKSSIQVRSKGHSSIAGDIVTQVDIEAQNLIIQELQPTIQKYDLGLLAEESPDTKNRLRKHAFWTIDPLDGTRYYADGSTGFCISVGLVSHNGTCILGAVLNPVSNELYHSIKGHGVYKNGQMLIQNRTTAPITRFADISLKEKETYIRQREKLDIQFCGGAICNIVQVIETCNSFYAKSKRQKAGGCAIWDLAVVSLLLTEMGGKISYLDGTPIHLNRPHTVYFHDVGIFCSNTKQQREEVLALIEL